MGAFEARVAGRHTGQEGLGVRADAAAQALDLGVDLADDTEQPCAGRGREQRRGGRDGHRQLPLRAHDLRHAADVAVVHADQLAGLARRLDAEYLAPEIIQSKGHAKEVDWWALGILIHEMLAGYPPYYDENQFGIYQKVLAGKIEYPRHFETQSRDIVAKLIKPERTKRIGSGKNGAEDIKKHKWYRGLNWAALYNKILAQPVDFCNSVPTVSSPSDTSNFELYPTSTDEGGPIVDAEKDEALFGAWGVLPAA